MNTAALAHKITWASSKQSYLTAVLLADRNLVDDCLRAYAYFRWADDMIDISMQDENTRLAFIERQKSLIDMLYNQEQVKNLTPEETMLADLIAHDGGENSGLQSFIRNFMAVLEFDALRKGHQIEQTELNRYTNLLSTAVMDGIQYFIGNCYAYARPETRCHAVMGAHITHMLRDTCEDIPAGYINIPVEYIESSAIDLQSVESEQYRDWVRERVQMARGCFKIGKRYINALEVLRCKLAGYCYCARFERILDAIEKENYVLRPNYDHIKGLSSWLAMARLGIEVIFRHLMGKIVLLFPYVNPLNSTRPGIPRRSL
ncbi:MAG: squalene/phytoene synthase family protein [Anaerolineales bacterium]|nr:squalene/phytoene synthase family protein [Anaerolineales bacterium]